MQNDVLWNEELKDLEADHFRYKFATLVVDLAFGIFGKVGRPLVYRGVGSLPLQFQNYPHQMLELQYSLLKDAFGGSKEAKKALMLMGLATLMAGGVLGAPAADDAKDILDWIIGKLGWKRGDTETFIRRALVDLFGNLTDEDHAAIGADAILRGLPYAAGIDVSQRIAFNRLPGSDLALAILGARGSVGNDLHIPVASILTKAATGVGHYNNENYVGLLGSLLPVRGAQNLIEAANWYENGVRTQRGGQVLPANKMKKERFSLEDFPSDSIFMKGIGFTPTEVSQAREKQYTKSQLTTGANAARASFAERASEAIIDKDQQKLERALNDLAEYNTGANPEDIITPESFRNSLKRKIQEKLLGRDIINKTPHQARGTAQDIDRLYPPR